MSDISRVSLSLEAPLLDKLDRLARENHYQNRSEFIRDLIRGELTRQEWNRNDEVLATLTLIYNHHQRGLTEKLVDLQHHCLPRRLPPISYFLRLLRSNNSW